MKHLSIRPLLGNDWAYFYICIGARGLGKTFSTQDFVLNEYRKSGTPFVWIRLSRISVDNLLQNDATKFIDPILVKKYNLELTTNGMDVYDKGQQLAKVIAVSEMAKQKGVALFDGDDDRPLNIVCDEIAREPSEKITYDLIYNLSGTLENLCRFRKKKVRVIMLCNALDQANEVCAALNFIPINPGVYKLKSKKAVIWFCENSPEYDEERKDTVAGILAGNQSNFTNKIEFDRSLINKKKMIQPTITIKFSKDPADWFEVWDSNVIARWNKEKSKAVIAMRPYLDTRFDKKMKDAVINGYNNRSYKFKDITSQLLFEKQIALLKPKG